MSDQSSNSKIAVIAGAGPAGLTAALELLKRSDVIPHVFELDGQVGGISKTINYRGNRMDLGGHRFFSKSDWVMKWWQDILPIAADQEANNWIDLKYQGKSRTLDIRHANRSSSDAVMLIRRRRSRIFYRRRFFNYPLTLDTATLKSLGLMEAARIGLSYGHARLAPISPETSLQEFFINRFGKRLYETFFRDYTEKVWGVPCSEISAEWGAQRVKGLSITKAILHALNLGRSRETSLIERFLYPKFGPGQLWEETARRVEAAGGKIFLNHKVVDLELDGNRIISAKLLDRGTARVTSVGCGHFISSMPVSELVSLLRPQDAQTSEVARKLPYRDFFTVGLLVKKMTGAVTPSDNWIYVQEPDVHIGRIQIFNNWSPALVADPANVWLGLEYFCTEGDSLWSMADDRLIAMASAEMAKLGLVDPRDILDATLVRVPKAYPAYFGSYQHFERIRTHLDSISNLYPVGRNGMHRYNNQDHSMLTAKAAVDCITGGTSRAAIWDVNADESYHEDFDRNEPRAAATIRI